MRLFLLALSLLGHAVLCFVFWREFSDTLEPDSVVHQYTVVDIGRAAGSSPRTLSQRAQRASRLTLSDLMPRPDSVDGFREGSAEGKETGASGLDAARFEGLYAYLHQRIEETLDYPNDLIEAGQEGTVYAVIQFAEDGSFQKKGSDFKGGSPYLRLLVRRALRRALAEPLPLSMRGKVKQVKAQFLFVINSLDDGTRTRQNPTSQGGQLFFVREHLRKLPFQLQRQMFAHRTARDNQLMATFDVLWLVGQVSRLFSKKVDKLQKYRDDPDY